MYQMFFRLRYICVYEESSACISIDIYFFFDKWIVLICIAITNTIRMFIIELGLSQCYNSTNTIVSEYDVLLQTIYLLYLAVKARCS